MRRIATLANYLPRRKTVLMSLGAVALFLVGGSLAYSAFFGPPSPSPEVVEFIVEPDQTIESVIAELEEEGFIRYGWAFRIAYLKEGSGRGVGPGGYRLSRNMDAWMLAKTLVSRPYLSYISFPPGYRKEQIAELLAKSLGWSDAEKEKWLRIDTAVNESVIEGVYYPDTYLVPSDQDPAQIAARLRGRFQDFFAPYAEEAARQGIAWTDVVTFASLVEREAAKNDKALVAGILWNRLEIGMPLAVDASLQYIRGEEGNWWPVPQSEDKFLESPFNTYQHAGLPPHPIANPSLDSIEAVLNPDRTSCLFYIHDNKGRIHCSPTYKGHLANINRYLK